MNGLHISMASKFIRSLGGLTEGVKFITTGLTNRDRARECAGIHGGCVYRVDAVSKSGR